MHGRCAPTALCLTAVRLLPQRAGVPTPTDRDFGFETDIKNRRTFVVNSNGTISPRCRPDLVLGFFSSRELRI